MTISRTSQLNFSRLAEWMTARNIVCWGAADLGGFSVPGDETGRSFPRGLSFAIPMPSGIMAGIRHGPSREYADEYARVNILINRLSSELQGSIIGWGHRALALAASSRTDPQAIRGDFPHKTAATRAGLGWIGRNCQLITRDFGPWVRLGTVFTDMELRSGPPRDRSFCGACTRCVDACPAGALKGNAWFPGIPREEILDAAACDDWKKTHYYAYARGHTCGICSSVCPYGLKVLGRKS